MAATPTALWRSPGISLGPRGWQSAGMEHLGVERESRVAHGVSEVLAPAYVAAVTCLAIAWASTHRLGLALGWGAVASLFTAAVPYAFIARGARRGRWADHHVPDRSQRTVPLAFALLSVLIGLGVLVGFEGPRLLVALVVSQCVGLAVVIAVSRVWKVSVHAAAVWGAAIVLILVFGPWLAVATVPAAAVCWSRWVLRAHSWAQVLVGAVMGGLIGGAVFTALR